VLVALAVAALAVHHHADRRRRELTGGLDAALAARDRGALDEAARRLEALADEHPGSAVPPYLLAEIFYKTGRVAAARPRFAEAVEIDQSLTAAYRYLAVIGLRLGDRRAAAAAAGRGLEVAPGDLELAYLAGRARGEGPETLFPEIVRRGPDAAAGLAGLAFDVGDAEGAAAIADHALARWPDDRQLYRLRLRLAQAAGDRAAAERVVEAARARGW
jgi:tetratricopeptide (TPR) repeat protein